MIETFYIGQGNLLPYYRFQVRDKDGAVDLSNAGVTAAYFCMKNLSTGSVVVSAPAIITDPTTGDGEYRWAVGDTAALGDFAAAVQFVTAAGDFSLPRSEMAKVVVEDKFVTG